MLDAANTTRRAGQNQIAVLKSEVLANVRYEHWKLENHVFCVSVLFNLTIHSQQQIQIVYVFDSIFGNKVADRTGCVESLSQKPRVTSLENLKFILVIRKIFLKVY